MNLRADTPPEVAPSLREYRDTLLGIAEASIDHGLDHGEPLAVDARDYPVALQAEHATFVTLLDGAGCLRGCVGTLEAQQPVVGDVSMNAYAAAFEDPRFPPLSRHGRAGLTSKLSVLTPPEPMDFDSEADLVSRLEPHVDGLLIEAGRRRGTFLPAVWEQIPDPGAFWLALKHKAGLARGDFPEDLRVYHYRAAHIS